MLAPMPFLSAFLPPLARRLLSEFRGHRVAIAAVLLLGLVISAIQPASVKITQLIIDRLQTGASGFPAWLPSALVGLFLVSGLAKYFYNVIRRSLCEKVLARLRERLFVQYTCLPLQFLDRVRTGDMLSSIQNDLHQINQGFDTAWDVFKEPFTFLGLIGAAFYFDWRLSLAIFLVIPVVVWVFSWSGAAVKRYATRNLSQYAELISLAQESLIGARVVRVFRLESVLAEKFSRIQKSYLDTAFRSIRVQEISTPVVELIGAALMAGVVLYGAWRIQVGDLSTGDLVAFLVALGLSQMPIKKLNNANLKMKTAEAAAERIYALLDAPPTLSGVGASRAVGFRDKIQYETVALSYDSHCALEGVSFELAAGQRLALVGPSGGGKTSIVNLLPRLYEPSQGTIRIDGVDIRTLDLAALRSLISYVTQDVFLFHDTIFENIRYGRPDASQSEIERAAELAHCTDFLARSPHGGATVVGDRGMRLSGGERQRIAIARAFLKGAPILILDEATSSLDSASEGIVQEALDELMVGKTALVVAHRFSTIRGADQILVVERGKIRQRGTHTTLVEEPGIYRGLFQQQTWS